MKENTPFLLSGKERPNSPGNVSPQRYQFLSLKDAEPNLGIPLTNALPASATWVLTTDSLGNRYFATTILSDSTYTTLKDTSGNYVSVFNTVKNLSGRWESSYTTLNTNSGTWLTVASASSLYYKSSGGDLFGSMNIFGNVLIYGTLSALSGLEFITTKATTTSSLSIVNVGIGPALYVEQDGFYDIARFVDKEGGIVLNVGNVTPAAPGTNGGVIGIRTDFPNHTLTVVGTFSASSDVYTDGMIVSAGVPLDTIIFNASGPLVKSVYATMSANSAKWESSYSYLNSNSANIVTFQLLSTTPVVLSAANILGNVNIFGNLFAAGSAFFANTIITTTSALSVINAGAGPALFVSQGRGPGDIASFYDGDNSKEVFHIGNATDAFGNDVDGVIGIKTGEPNKTLTVVGEISSTSFINNLLLDYTQGNVVLGKNITITSFGYDNVFIGHNAAVTNTFGINNVFIGARAGQANTQGNYNTFVGQNAGQSNTLGNNNSIFGSQAGSNLQTGYSNTIIGNAAASNLTIGAYNIIMGDNSGGSIVTSNYNIIIGQSAASQSTDWSRTLVIGNNANPSQNYQAIIGDPTFPFVEGIYYGNMGFYGTLSATRARMDGATILGHTTINSTLSSLDGTVKILGNQTITGALSVTTLSATNIVGFYSILPYQNFTGNGSNTDFTLLSAARSVNDIMVFVGGVYQSKDYYTLITPNLLRMSTPPPNGTLLEVSYQKPSQIPFSVLPLPAPGTIQYSMLANRIVDSDKLTFDAVSSINIADYNITPVKLTRGGPGWSTAGTLTANNIFSPGLISSIQNAVSSLSAQVLLKGTFIHATSSFLLPAFGITRRGKREVGSMRYNTDTGIYEAFHSQFETPATGLAEPGWYGLGRTLISSNRFTAGWSSINTFWMTPGNLERHNYSAFDIETFIPRGTNAASSNRLRLYFRFIPYTTFAPDSNNSYWTGGRWYNNNTGSAEVFNNGSNATGISYGMYTVYNGDANYWWAGAGNTGYQSILRMRTNPGTAVCSTWQGSLYTAHQTSYAQGAHTDFHVEYIPAVSIAQTYLGRTIYPIAGFHIGCQEGSINADAYCNAIVNVYGINGWEGNQVYE